jgi:hypothetical protein
MFRSETVFILGAGSSEEVGLPIGSRLKEYIASEVDIKFDQWGTKLISGNQNIVDALGRKTSTSNGRSGSITPYLHSAWRIRDALPQAISIDNFLDAFSGNDKIELCGKLGIVASILKAERSSSLMLSDQHESRINFDNVSSTWFSGLFQLLTENVNRLQVDSIFDNISIINFNYDRCVEHFLDLSLQNYYGLTPNESASVLSKLNVLHPYGLIGQLPTQQVQFTGQVPFGSKNCDLLASANLIKTFSEQIEEQSALYSVKDTIRKAQKLVFLGFAFHRQNLELLSPTSECDVKAVYSTAFGVSKSDCQVVEGELRSVFKQRGKTARIEFRNDLKCGPLFNEYWRSLSA